MCMFWSILMLLVTTQKQYQATAVRAYININHYTQKYKLEGSTTSYLERSLDAVFGLLCRNVR